MKVNKLAGVDRGPGNHAVGADDAVVNGTPRDVFSIHIDMFNSWGLSFGDKGRCLLSPEHLGRTDEVSRDLCHPQRDQ